MADHAVEDDGDVDIFVYRGGRAPQHITRARIDESVEVIEDRAFEECLNLVHVETHNRIRKIGFCAFYGCDSLPRIDIKSVVEIVESAFFDCEKLQFVEFGDKLERIGNDAFSECPIEHLKLPSVVSVDNNVFGRCKRLIDVEFSEKLERISWWVFNGCDQLQRIAIPLKTYLFPVNGGVFDQCHELKRVDLVGVVHQTISSLHMECWRAEMDTEINRINLLLSDDDPIDKTWEIRRWMNSVSVRLEHYKTEHISYVKEAATLLELALWKAKLDEKDHDCWKENATKKAKVDVDDARKECRVTCGADTVIKNVLPFLQLSE